MADKELTRIETLKKKRKEYDDQRIKAEKEFQQARKKGDTEAEKSLGRFIGQRRRGIELIDSQIKKEERIEQIEESKAKKRKKETDELKKINDSYFKRDKLIKSTMQGVRNMNKEVLEKVNLDKANLGITKLLKEGRKQEAAVYESIVDGQIEMLGIKNRQQLLDFDAAKSLEDIRDKEFEIQQLEQDILDGKVQNTDKAKAMVKILKLELNTSNQILKNTKQKSDEAKAQKAAADKLRESSMDLVDAAEKQVMFAKELVKQMLANPYLAVAAGFMAIIKLLESMVNRSKQFQEQIKGTVSQGSQLSKELAVAEIHAKALGYSTAEAAGAIVDEFGSLNDVSADTVRAMGSFEKGLGISMSTSAKLMKNMQSVSGLTQEQSIELIKSGAAMAKINGVAPGAIMEDIANNTEEFAKYGRDGGKNMIRAAIHAKKLGLELGTLAKTSDSLLNFEESIQAEMEASMLIGKQMNLNKAREKALSGDLAGMAEEIKKQVGGQAEFEKMNVIQREALAASVGMSAAELGKMMSGEVAVKGEMDKIDAEEALSKDLDTTSLALRNLMTVDNALKLAVIGLTAIMALNALKSGGLMKALGGFGTKLTGLFGKGASKTVAKTAAKTTAKTGAKAVAKTAAKESAKTVAKTTAKTAAKNVAKTTAKTGAKSAGKSLLKKIPGVGLIAGLGFAATRLMKGDALGALGEVASGAASILPGVGTAVSTAIDVGLAARDITKAVGTTAETVQDATKVQIKERDAIIQKEKSMSTLSKQQAEAKKAAEDAIIEEKKLNEKKAAKLVEQQKVQVEKPKGPSKEQLEEQLRKKRVGEKMAERRIRSYEKDGVTAREKNKIAHQERVLEQNKRDQAALLDAIKKLTETTANLKND